MGGAILVHLPSWLACLLAFLVLELWIGLVPVGFSGVVLLD